MATATEQIKTYEARIKFLNKNLARSKALPVRSDIQAAIEKAQAKIAELKNKARGEEMTARRKEIRRKLAVRTQERDQDRRGETKYSIKGGDTLSALAKAKGTTLGAIRRANPKRFPTAASFNKIKVGEKINMPPNVKASTPYDVKTVRQTTTPPAPKPKPSRKAGKDTGKVKRFDPDIAAALPEKAGLMPWNWKQLTGPEDRSPGKRTYETPFGDLEVDSSVDTSYPGDEYKKGGRLKKSVKKAKAKPRKAKAKTRKVAQKQKPRGVGVARNGFGKAMYV